MIEKQIQTSEVHGRIRRMFTGEFTNAGNNGRGTKLNDSESCASFIDAIPNVHKQVDLLSNLQFNVNPMDLKKDKSEPKIKGTDKKIKSIELDSVNGSISARSASQASIIAKEIDHKRKMRKKRIYR